MINELSILQFISTINVLFYYCHIFSLFIVSATIYIKSSKAIENQVSVYLYQMVKSVNAQLDEYIKSYELATLPLVTNDDVRDFIDGDIPNSYQRFINYREINGKFKDIILERPEIEQIYLIEQTGQYLVFEEKSGQKLEVANFYQELEELIPKSGEVFAYGRINNQKLVITIARKIRNRAFEPKGTLAIDIDASKLLSSWGDIEVNDDHFFIILDEEGQVVYHPELDYVGKKLDASLQGKFDKQLDSQFYHEWNNEEMFFLYRTSDYTGWKVAFVVSRAALFEPISGIRSTTLFTGILTLLIALYFAQHFIRKIVNPIQVIEKTMRSVEKGQWELAPVPNRNDEITRLIKSYNKMVERLSFLVDQVYKAELENKQAELLLQQRELEKKEVEFQALQSQINPHFLYNTLGTMNSYAILKEVDEISEMSAALANMFHYAVQNLKVVTLNEELDNVKDYLIIQQYRWQKIIPLEINLDKKFLHAKIVKLTIQPLIENAIEHGLQPITDSSKVVIKGSVRGDLLLLSVIDNGIGIQREKLIDLRERLKSEDLQYKADQGIGLLNVDKRIKLLFGDQYGLDIDSECHSGTTITMTVPYRTSDDQEKLK